MLNITNLVYHVAGKPIFSDATLQIFANQRVGLVGKNGCGKSTLFRLIRAEIKPDGGDVALQSGKTIGFVAQEIDTAERPAVEFVLDGDTELRELENTLAKENHDTVWFEAQHRYEAIDGYGAKARAAQLLDGLGFKAGELERNVSSFSGGWRMRLNLARALMRRADLLLLDEPTNHLDLEAIIWLEQYLARYPGSILLVSHDREFLNAVVNRIAHVHDGVIDSYTGDYDAFEIARAERASQQNDAFRNQQAHIAHLEDYVRRFRAKATKAKQAQSRLKALERLERIAPAHVEAGHFGLTIEAPERSPDLLLRADKLSFGYADKPIFANVNFSLRQGSRIALLGPNGAGKSTFVKLLAGELSPTSGTLEAAPDIRIGYFAQHQLERLVATDTPLEHMQRLAPKATTLELRTFLGRFGLASEEEMRPVETFSGGEKSRLALALIAWLKPHLLLLDEPTNHLDLDMRDALTLALEEYTGAIVLVSHDRALIRATSDELWLVADDTVAVFDGDLEDYKTWLESRHASAASPKPDVTKTRSDTPARPKKKALRSKQEKLEKELAQAQARLAELNRQLSDPASYANPLDARIAECNAEHRRVEERIAQLEEAWLELEEAIEGAV